MAKRMSDHEATAQLARMMRDMADRIEADDPKVSVEWHKERVGLGRSMVGWTHRIRIDEDTVEDTVPGSPEHRDR